MESHPLINLTILLDFVIAAVALGAAVIAKNHYKAPCNRWGIAVAALHPLTAIGLFYSLAFHMHRSLGGWPKFIGNDGFPSNLVLHADVALQTFMYLLIGALFLLPVAVLACLCVPKLRPGVGYLGVYALTSAIAFAAMQMAPKPFLSWWWD